MNINIIILIITQHISAVVCDQIMPSSPISLILIKSIGKYIITYLPRERSILLITLPIHLNVK